MRESGMRSSSQIDLTMMTIFMAGLIAGFFIGILVASGI